MRLVKSPAEINFCAGFRAVALEHGTWFAALPAARSSRTRLSSPRSSPACATILALTPMAQTTLTRCVNLLGWPRPPKEFSEGR
jgi:hypothetical protein